MEIRQVQNDATALGSTARRPSSFRVVAAIPAFNEEVCIGSVVLRTRQYVDEVIVVDDGSSDATAEVATLAGARVVRHERNGGYGAALRTIFGLARAESWGTLVILDSDGQHNPDDVPAIIEPVVKGEADVSIGSRFLDRAHREEIPGYRQVGINVLTGLTNVGASAGHKVTDGQSGFRAYSRRAVQCIEPKDNGMGISAEILFQARKSNLAFAEVPIKVRYDVDGSSQNPVRHGIGVLSSIIQYVQLEHPLLFFGLAGFLTLLAGLLLAGFSLSRYFQDRFLPFGPTIGSAALIIVGLLCCFTGLILHSVILASKRR